MKTQLRKLTRAGKTMLAAAVLIALTASLTGCTDAPEYEDDVYGNFDALADIIDTRYCFFEEKDIDWKSTVASYRGRLQPGMTDRQLFALCSDMLDCLRDGHVNLSSRFNTSYYRRWWTDYAQDFNLRTLQQYYLGFDYGQVSGISYKKLQADVGYMYFPSFSTPVSATSLDLIISSFADCKALIIDIRNNGGGMLTNIDTFVGRFIDTEVTGGYIRHKTGPGHSDFSAPYRFSYKPPEGGHVTWLRPVFVLTNRSCYSAANDFVAVMKSLPQVKIVGSRTGGGGGLPFSSELPNGWSVRFSACPITAPDGSETEAGIDPSPGCECHASEEELAGGKDGILDFALRLAGEMPPLSQE